MAYVIAQPCIGTKDTSCVPACPVDCIYQYDEPSAKLVIKTQAGAISRSLDTNPNWTKEQLNNQLFIKPDECIDCGACVEPCPVQAIFPEEDLKDEWKHFAAINCDAFA